MEDYVSAEKAGQQEGGIQKLRRQEGGGWVVSQMSTLVNKS